MVWGQPLSIYRFKIIKIKNMKRILTIAIALFTIMSFAQTQPQKASDLVSQQKKIWFGF